MKKIFTNTYTISILLFVIGICTRIPFLEHFQSHWDGAEYSMAILHYSLVQDTPSPPGYPLYIFLGKIIYQFVHNPHTALLIVSVLFSGLTAYLFFILGSIFLNKEIGIIASLIYLSSPVFYFLGITAHGYGITVAPLLLLIILIVRVIKYKKSHPILLGILFSITIGIRPQDSIFTTGLFLYSLFIINKPDKIKAIISFLLFTTLWFIPILSLVGGLIPYLQSLKNATTTNAIPLPTFTIIEGNIFQVIRGIFLTFGIGIIIFISTIKFIHKKNFIKVKKNKYYILFLVWILPAFLFNIIIRSDQPGHQVSYLAGLIVVFSVLIFESFKGYTKVMYVIVMIICIFNIYNFFRDRDPDYKLVYTPTSFHYSEIQKNDIQLGSIIPYIVKHFNPNKTIIITSAQPWRPLTYHLNKFEVIDLEGLYTNDSHYTSVEQIGNYLTMQVQSNKKMEFQIPKKVYSLVFTVASTCSYIHQAHIKLPGNTCLTVLKVKPNQVFSYKINRFANISK